MIKSELEYLKSIKKQFEYYKSVGDKTFNQLDEKKSFSSLIKNLIPLNNR